MTTTDTIILVREAKTCSYVLVVHTPRLCGEPGFKSRLESRDESFIRCREIVESITPSTNTDSPLVGTDRPLNKASQRQPLLTVPSRPPADPPAGDANSGKGKVQHDRLRKMLEAVLGNQDNAEFPQVIVEQINLGENGEEDLVFQFELDDLASDGQTDDHHGHAGTHQSLLETLRAAGIEVKGEKTDDKKDEREEKKAGVDLPQGRDEL
jgi:protein OS-9